MKNRSLRQINSFIPGAHRGASSEFPGNSIEAFERAAEIIPNCLLEMDVQRTLDGEIVIFHDDILELTTDASGPLCDYPLEDVKKIDAGYNISFDKGSTFPFRGKGYRIVTFKEILERFPGYRISIDIKYRDTAFAESVLSLIKKFDAVDSTVVGSFHGKVSRFVRESHPDTVRSFSKSEIIWFMVFNRFGISGLKRKKDDILMVPEFIDRKELYRIWPLQGFRVLTRKFIRDAHEKAIPVLAWTINRIENMCRLIRWGIDGIVTDYPDRLRKAMEIEGILFP